MGTTRDQLTVDEYKVMAPKPEQSRDDLTQTYKEDSLAAMLSLSLRNLTHACQRELSVTKTPTMGTFKERVT